MKNIFIVGGNGFARECFLGLTQLPKYGEDVTFGGFLGHGGYGTTVDYKSNQHLYLGEVSDYKFGQDDYCIIGAAYPSLRKKIYNDLKQIGAKFYNLICNGVILSDSFDCGEANVFGSPFVSTVDIKIGNGNVFNGGVIVAHDCEIGDFNFFAPRSQVLGNVKIGDSNSFGANSIMLPNSSIGNNNTISPLSVIYKGCGNNCKMHGNPALKIDSNEED